jgi:hypothetical protein
MKQDYYSVKNMDCPTPKMYQITKDDNVLIIGTAKKQIWATTIDIDPKSPADFVCDGCDTPFKNKQFDVVILDFTTNFIHPSKVNSLIKEANRVGKKVKGRCHISRQAYTLRGSKQAYCHKYIPSGVEWIEIRLH